MRQRIHVILMMFIFTIGIIGCAGPGSYGSFAPDNAAKSFFETYQINNDYEYYFSGSDTYPVALLALHKSYKMGNDLWRPISLTPALMEQLVANMQTKLTSCCYQNQFGFNIYDHKGKLIGMLYSYLGVGLTFRVDDEGFIRIAGPRDDDQLKIYQGRTRR